MARTRAKALTGFRSSGPALDSLRVPAPELGRLLPATASIVLIGDAPTLSVDSWMRRAGGLSNEGSGNASKSTRFSLVSFFPSCDICADKVDAGDSILYLQNRRLARPATTSD